MQAVKKAVNWFQEQGWQPFEFQLDAWNAYLEGYHGLVNAPTGSGKTYSLVVPMMLESLEHSAENKGVQAIWITPIRALAKEIQLASQRAARGLGVNWNIAIRSGDTRASEKQKQKKNATPNAHHNT